VTNTIGFESMSTLRWKHKKQLRGSYRDIEIDNPFVLVIGDECRLHAHIGDVDRTREHEKHSQARQQEA
jgi:hypothetical protein